MFCACTLHTHVRSIIDQIIIFNIANLGLPFFFGFTTAGSSFFLLLRGLFAAVALPVPLYVPLLFSEIEKNTTYLETRLHVVY